MTKIQKIHCNKCSAMTNHDVEYEESKTEEDETETVWLETTTLLLKCRGCDEYTKAIRTLFSEDIEYTDKAIPNYRFKYYPSREDSIKSKPQWHNDFPLDLFNENQEMIKTMIDEIYGNLSLNNNMSAMLMCRCLLEFVAINYGDGDKGSFTQNISEIVSKGYLTEEEKDNFNSIIYDAGSAAMHRNWTPSKEDVEIVLDNIESLLFNIFIKPKKDQELDGLKNRTPQRT